VECRCILISGSQVRALVRIFRNPQLTARKQMLTLNQRVPGSSPGAPTKLIKHLALDL
jgi:hypothetical protein